MNGKIKFKKNEFYCVLLFSLFLYIFFFAFVYISFKAVDGIMSFKDHLYTIAFSFISAYLVLISKGIQVFYMKNKG